MDHWDGTEEQGFVVDVKVVVALYFLQCAHCSGGRCNSCGNIFVVAEAAVDE